MARKRLISDSPIGKSIMEGEYDADLDTILAAVAYRKKVMFRPGSKVRLSGTRNTEIDGQIGTVIKVNAKRISVGLGEKSEWGYEQEFLVPASMLTAVEA